MTNTEKRGPHDPMWEAPDGLARRAYFGHEDERDVPGYCTCWKPTKDCTFLPRQWVTRWGRHFPGDGCEAAVPR